MIDRQSQLDEVHAAIDACVSCRAQGLSIQKPRVMRRGKHGATIFVIGLAPGAAALRHETAFAGYSITRLLKWFSDAGFAMTEEQFRAKTYLTSIVKCSIEPDTRHGRSKLWGRCQPFLWRQLELIEPRLILILGAEPLAAIFGDQSLKLQALLGRMWGTNEIFSGQLFPPVSIQAKWLALPHPSGLSRTMNDGAVYERAIGSLRSALVNIGFSV